MLNIFLIILMLSGIVVFSLQPADKTTVTATLTNKAVAVTHNQTEITIVNTAVKPAVFPLLLTGGNTRIKKTA